MWQVYLLGQGHQQVRDARHRLSRLVHLAHEVLHTAGIFLGFVIDPAGDALHDPGGSLVSDNSGKERDLLLLLGLDHLDPVDGLSDGGGGQAEDEECCHVVRTGASVALVLHS